MAADRRGWKLLYAQCAGHGPYAFALSLVLPLSFAHTHTHTLLICLEWSTRRRTCSAAERKGNSLKVSSCCTRKPGSDSLPAWLTCAKFTRQRIHTLTKLTNIEHSPPRGGLVLKAHRLLYHSALGSRVIKKKKDSPPRPFAASLRRRGEGSEREGRGPRAQLRGIERGLCVARQPFEVDKPLPPGNLRFSLAARRIRLCQPRNDANSGH